MKNTIITQLRRIRDAHAKKFNYDIEAMGRDLMKLEPWMERKTYTRRGNRFVPLTSRHKVKRTAAANSKRH